MEKLIETLIKWKRKENEKRTSNTVDVTSGLTEEHVINNK